MRSNRRLLALLTATALVTAVAACSSDPPDAHTIRMQSGTPRLTGTHGAVHFDDGYLQVGSGAKMVDLFVDPMCPFCRTFESSSGPMLFADATAGLTTVRIHPLALLNRLSMGTDYSTRAAAVITAVGVEDPARIPEFIHLLYEKQPREETTGLTDAQLLLIAHESGALSVTVEDITRYAGWVDSETSKALSGPVAATDEIASIRRVPTVVVDRAVFAGNSNETAAFSLFYRSH